MTSRELSMASKGGSHDGLSLRGWEAMTTVTRADLAEAAHVQSGLARTDTRDLVDQCLAAISDALAAGENVGTHGFGSFNVSRRANRTGRNPTQPDEEIIVPARRVVTFRPSRRVLRAAVDRGVQGKAQR